MLVRERFQCLESYTLQSRNNRLEGVVAIAPPTSRNIFCMQLYYCVQASVSVVRNSEVVRYSGAAIVLRYNYSRGVARILAKGGAK